MGEFTFKMKSEFAYKSLILEMISAPADLYSSSVINEPCPAPVSILTVIPFLIYSLTVAGIIAT